MKAAHLRPAGFGVCCRSHPRETRPGESRCPTQNPRGKPAFLRNTHLKSCQAICVSFRYSNSNHLLIFPSPYSPKQLFFRRHRSHQSSHRPCSPLPQHPAAPLSLFSSYTEEKVSVRLILHPSPFFQCILESKPRRTGSTRNSHLAPLKLWVSLCQSH